MGALGAMPGAFKVHRFEMPNWSRTPLVSLSPGEALPLVESRKDGNSRTMKTGQSLPLHTGATSLATADLPSEYRVAWPRPGKVCILWCAALPREVFALGDGATLPGGPNPSPLMSDQSDFFGLLPARPRALHDPTWAAAAACGGGTGGGRAV